MSEEAAPRKRRRLSPVKVAQVLAVQRAVADARVAAQVVELMPDTSAALMQAERIAAEETSRVLGAAPRGDR